MVTQKYGFEISKTNILNKQLISFIKSHANYHIALIIIKNSDCDSIDNNTCQIMFNELLDG